MTIELVAQQQETQTVDNISITETSMKEYFERIVNHVVGLSEQARKVDELTQRVNDMSVRIGMLETENYNLKQDLQAQIEQAHRNAQERDATVIELNSAREHAHALAETIITRDSRVTDLQHQLDESNAHATSAYNELTVANNRVTDLEALVSDLRAQLEAMTQDRDHLVGVANNYEREAQEYKSQLDRISSLLNPQPVYQAQVA